jgi:hypothetical protein
MDEVVVGYEYAYPSSTQALTFTVDVLLLCGWDGDESSTQIVHSQMILKATRNMCVGMIF